MKKKIKKQIKTTTATKEFTCTACGYPATKLAKLSHCPLCLVCKKCSKKIRHCLCKEGE